MCNSYGFGILYLVSVYALVVAVPALGAGQAVGIEHPVLDYGIDPAKAAQYEKAVERVMAMSEAEMLSFVPEKPVSVFCYCPNCHGGSQGNGVFTWSVDRPDELKCRYCGMVFPNEQYGDDQVMEGKNALGETITYQYHQDKKYPDLREFFGAHILSRKRSWVLARCFELGKAYQATKKPEYARRAALILDRIAQVYPHYPVVKQWTGTFDFVASQAPPYPSNGGRWGRWTASELPGQPAPCYDLVYDSDEFDKLSEERGYGVREKLENDFFKAIFEANNTPPLTEGGQLSTRNLRRAGIIGWVINEPRIVHWSFGWLKHMACQRCFYDGMLNLAPSYHYQILGDFKRAFANLNGYSDPAGYLDEVDGTRFDNLVPEEEVPFIVRAYDAPSVLDFPNGCSSPIHDTWPGERRSKPRDKTVSTICPGYGHASLGRGEGTNQMQAQLHFSGAYGHSHRDNLNLIIWAKEREMVSDLGYTHTRVRSWNGGTIGHNLVAIDRKMQDGGGNASAGDLLWYFPDTEGISVTEADGKRGYHSIEGVERYRRLLVLVPVSDEDAYVVDIFRTKGGSVHDWLLHGDADHDMTATCSLELEPGRDNMLEEGEEWEEPTREGSRFNHYGVIRDVAEAKSDENVVTTFRYAQEPDRGIRVHVLGDEATEVYLGRSPSARRAKNEDSKAFEYWMPQLVLRRHGAGALQSTFVAVEEPFGGEPFIDSISRLEVNPTDEGVVALQVTHGDTVDTIISTLDEAPYPERTTEDGISIKGRLGIVRQLAGNTIGMWLFEGEELVAKDGSITSEKGACSGEIQAATRKADGADEDSFITDASLPEGQMLQGVWMIVTHGNGFTHGYPIERVEKQDGKTVIVLSMDHGLKVHGDKTGEIYFPQREIEGKNTFVIPLAAAIVNH